MRLQPGSERRRGNALAVSQHRGPTPRAQQPVQPVLDHQRHNLRQLPLLAQDRIPNPVLAAVKPMPAPAAERNMRNVIIDPLRCGELPGLALMPRLPAALLTQRLLRPTTRLLPPLLTGHRRIIRRRLRAVARVLLEQPLVLIHPLPQRGDLRQQPKHQLNRRLTTRPSDPLRIPNTHERKIPCALKESSRSPRPHLNAYTGASVVGKGISI